MPARETVPARARVSCFLLPGLVVTWYVTGRQEALLPLEKRKAMAHYLRCHQQADGGWGTHIESPSTMFGTTLCYVALRLLVAEGAEADDEDEDEETFARGRSFLCKRIQGTGACLSGDATSACPEVSSA